MSASPPRIQRLMFILDALSVCVRWLRFVATCAALFWLSFRAYIVLIKPVEELIRLLGHELPIAPTISLLSIKADGLALHVKLPDHRTGNVEYSLVVNGISVSEISQPNAFTVTGLKPDSCYIIRVTAHNSSGFHVASDPLRVQTKPADSKEFFCHLSDDDLNHLRDPDVYQPAPSVQPYGGFTRTTASSSSPLGNPKEHGGNASHTRRTNLARRVSAPVDETDQHQNDSHGRPDDEGMVSKLASKLDSLRRDNEDIEKLLVEDDKDFEAMKVELTKRSNELRQELRRRDAESREQKRRIAELEKEDANAQHRKAAQEKRLQERLSSQKKLKEYGALWDREVEEFEAEVERVTQEKAASEKQTQDQIRELQDSQAEHVQATKRLEEQIRSIGRSMEELKEMKRKLDVSDAEAAKKTGRDTTSSDEDKQWEERLMELQTRYATAWTGLQQAQIIYQQAQQRLEYLNQRRASQSQVFPPSPIPDDSGDRRNPMHRRRTGSIRQDPGYPTNPAYGITSAPTFNTAISSVSSSMPLPASVMPTSYFNLNSSGMVSSNVKHTSISVPGIDALTGGGPMSPTAGDLLPAGLLGDEPSSSPSVDDTDRISERNRSSGIFPGLGAPIPGLGAMQSSEQNLQGPNSPISMASRSPSIFSSPRNSAGHLPFPAASEGLLESDRRSIQSATGSSRGVGGSVFVGAGGTRFGNIFGLNRQRGKTLPHEGPAIGSLKGSESQSMPRPDQSKLDPIGTRRRRGSHSGTWVDQMSNVLTRNSKAAEEDTPTAAKDTTVRKKTFNMFGLRHDPWSSAAVPPDAPSSPRPGSRSSIDNYTLPRPSTESQQRFGWPVEGSESRNHSLGADWAMSSRTSWSPHPSRRTSATGPFAPVFETDRQNSQSAQLSPSQPPIGTRPGRFKGPITPKLNPTAPNFKSLFVRDKRSDKADKSGDRDKDRGKGRDNDSDTPFSDPLINLPMDTSPSDPRRSRDGRSISTAADSHESRNSLDVTTSNTPSETLTPSAMASPGGKETLMQKLSRKSSSGKFNFPSFGKNRDGLFAGMKKERTLGVAGDAGETEEDGESGISLRRSFDSGGTGAQGSGKSSGLSWSSLKRRKRGGDKAPSVSESGTSEVGDDGD